MSSTDLDKIAAFIRKHHVMTLATTGRPTEGGLGQSVPESPRSTVCQPWCAHVFYAWMPEEGCFVFTTDPATRHGRQMTENANVAAAIALETRTVGRIQGLQIEGTVRRPDVEAARGAYLRRFPYATFVDLHLWILEPGTMKLTDNTLGFGKKLVWERHKDTDK